MTKPYATACDQNQQVIWDAINPWLAQGAEVLEIGSGTGQHGVYFADARADIVWQPSDLAENLAGISAWVKDAGRNNLKMPFELDVRSPWPAQRYDVIFTANSFHIMSMEMVAQCISNCVLHLKTGGYLIVYGPFNYNNQYTSASNASFDLWLKARDPLSAIKDFEWVNQLLSDAGAKCVEDIAMPANNRTLIWQCETSRNSG